MARVKKENRVERVKRERDALDCLEDILRYAREGFHSIVPDDLDVRLRWYGLYTQRPPEDGFFMLRVKIPNAALTSDQLETLGRLSIRYAQNTGDVTTRQDIQFHFVRIDDVPAIFEDLSRIGLSTSGACGDITRNVTGCPLAGIDAAEFINAESLVAAVHAHFLDNREFSNLPRKFKISISGCSVYCAGHEINDIGLAGLRRDDGRIAFDLWVGGGLGAKERFADRLGAHVFPIEVEEVCHHICAIFRDHGNRASRSLARLKFLLADWGPARFRRELERRLGRKLTDGDAPTVPLTANRNHTGLHPQFPAGLFYAGIATRRGRLTGDQMVKLARLARKHAGGRVRLTIDQNIILLDVPQRDCDSLVSHLASIDLPVEPSPFRAGTFACTGKQFCKLALTETKERASELIEHLEHALPGFETPLRISVTGCPNSCAHYQVCDVGLVGDFINTPTGKREAYRVYLGGHLGADHAFGRELELKIPAEELRFFVERLAQTYRAHRAFDGEPFHAFIARYSIDEIQAVVSPEKSGAAA